MVLLSILLLHACGTSSKYHCPELPYYPAATKIRSFDRSSATRVTMYEVHEQPEAVLAYYVEFLSTKGWKEESIDRDGVEFVYGYQSELPVVMTITIDEVSSNRVQYSSYLLLSSPSGNFKTICTTLWP
jgi:hypothetical protein